MIKIDRHISDLLYEHDCVIVPELGGFIASYAGSSIHPVQHTLTAPSKKIAFNALLNQNDGLLASYVAQTESFTYNSALKEIEGYVEGCKLQLVSGNKVLIEQVGTLYKNAEGNLQFEPLKNVNYLKDSFGFTTIQFLPIEQIKSAKEVSKKVREFAAIRPSKSQAKPEAKSKIKYSRKKIVNTILISGSILWLSFNLYLVSPSKFSLSGFNPVAETINVAKPEVTIAEKPVVSTPAPAAVEMPKPVVVEEKKAAVPETIKQATQQTTPAKISENSFYVVGGAFRSDDNARNFSESLKSEGFKNARVIHENAKLKLVCFDGFGTLEEAASELNRVKSMQKNAWIYRN